MAFFRKSIPTISALAVGLLAVVEFAHADVSIKHRSPTAKFQTCPRVAAPDHFRIFFEFPIDKT
jgi:hypothetical protein